MLALALALVAMVMLQSEWVLYPFLSVGANALCERALNLHEHLQLRIMMLLWYFRDDVDTTDNVSEDEDGLDAQSEEGMENILWHS